MLERSRQTSDAGCVTGAGGISNDSQTITERRAETAAVLVTALPAGESILSAVGFPARTSATPGTWKESTLASDQGCGRTLPESFAFFDRVSSSWKTYQQSLFGGLTEFLETWPRAGSMRNGSVYRRASLVSITNATGRSLLPTPRAADGLAHKIRSSDSVRRMMEDQGRSRPSRLEDAMALMGGEGAFANPQWLLSFMGFPRDWLISQTEQSAIPSSHKSPSGSDGES